MIKTKQYYGQTPIKKKATENYMDKKFNNNQNLKVKGIISNRELDFIKKNLPGVKR